MLRWIFAGLAALVLVLAGGLYLYLLSSLPRTEGRLVLAGPKAEIRIERDAMGVPTIIAKSDEDAAFGLGYAHAQDRLFQMELMRRYGAGRLAEIFGPEALPVDKEMRVFDLYRAAEADIPALSPAVNRTLAAYAAGVNALLAAHRGALPPEFLLLRFAPRPWSEADSLVWGKLMALQLEGNFRGELLRARMARTIPAADLNFLFPEYPKTALTTLAALRPYFRRLALGRLYRALPPSIGPVYESNEWVVDGRHSRSGKPLLANDPHLPLAAPGVWYLARLDTPAGEIAGATAPGVPFVVIGHNDHIAWGFTTTTSDVEDLFIEKVDPANPGRYLTPAGSTPFPVRHETIRVRGAAPVDLTLRATRHGPVLSDVLEPGTVDPGYVLALAATFLARRDRSAETLWKIDRAADWQSFKAAFEDFVGPPQNVVYADTSGTIGFIAPGLVPIRKSGEGWTPAPGWTGAYDWEGFVPFDALPSATNPASGHFINANNKIVPDSYPYFLSRDWDLPDRALRIAQLLAATPVQTPASSAAIQADTYSLMAAQLVPLMTPIEPVDAAEREALAILRRWNFHMDRDRVAPLLFAAWLRQFSHSVLFGRFGDSVKDYWGLRPQVMRRVLTERPDWCADRRQPAAEGCAARLRASLDTALDELDHAYGGDMREWRWGRAHPAIFANAVFGRVPILRDWVDLSLPVSGAADTILHMPANIRDDKAPFASTFGAGLRMITDLSAPSDSQMIVGPGQSGNPLSPHFADLLPGWENFRRLVPDRAATVATLFIEPAR